LGTLILHGLLYGYTPHHPEKVVKGHRIICSKRRKKHKGCGKCFSIRLNNYMPRLWYHVEKIWDFIVERVVRLKPIRQRNHALGVSLKTAYRLFTRFKRSQTPIRTQLIKITSPPDSTTSLPYYQTIEHLKKAFPHSRNPIASFHDYFQRPFLV